VHHRRNRSLACCSLIVPSLTPSRMRSFFVFSMYYRTSGRRLSFLVSRNPTDVHSKNWRIGDTCRRTATNSLRTKQTATSKSIKSAINIDHLLLPTPARARYIVEWKALLGQWECDSSAVYASAASLQDGRRCRSRSVSALAAQSGAYGKSKGSTKRKLRRDAGCTGRTIAGLSGASGTFHW
jgi:hypothetical protein